MPVEQKTTEIYYVRDGFGRESWHYAASAPAALKAHKFHFHGNEGLTKNFKEEPKVIPSPLVVGQVVCLDEPCCNFAGVPHGMAARMNSERVTNQRGQ